MLPLDMGELRCTYVGWQGWLLETSRTRVAIDAVLVDAVGRGPPASRVEFLFPLARRFDWAAFPPLDAYVLTHEHEDHFNVATLALLDRRVPIYLSERASDAARTLLAEMGFTVTLLPAGGAVTLGELTLTLFTPLDEGALRSDEWDTLAYCASAEGAGAFFTPVDVSLTDGMRAHVAEQPTDVLVFTELSLSLGATALDDFDPLRSHRRPAGAVDARGAPERAMAALAQGQRLQLHPGLTVTLRDGRLAEVADRAPFLETLGARPHRAFRKPDEAELSPPVSGRTQLSAEELAELERCLQELAEFLYGRTLFTQLCSLDARELGEVQPTFALVLLLGEADASLVYAYRPRACAFERRSESTEGIEARYVGTVLLWAGDFLAMARGELEPRTLGHVLEEAWRIPDCSLWRDWWVLYHPLRFPSRVLAQYRRALAEEAGTKPRVRAAQSGT